MNSEIINSYKAVFQDNKSEIFTSESHGKALNDSFLLEEVHGVLFNLYLLNEQGQEIKTLF